MGTKVLALWLFIVALVWAFGFVWLHLTMTGFTDPVLPLPLHLALGFSGPFVLVVGSTLLMALSSRYSLAAWLTWQLAPDWIMGLIEPRRPLEAPKPYVAVFTILAFVLLADIGAVAAFRRVRKTI